MGLNINGVGRGSISHYNYDPSVAAAIVVAVLYTITFIITLFQWIKYRAWVWIVMVLAAGMEVGGYIVRAISAKNQTDEPSFVAQFSLVVLAPVMMSAACYVIFARIVYHVVPTEARTTKLLWISPRFITPIFVVCDIVTLLLQLFGAVKVTSVNLTDPNAKEKLNKGKRLAIIGVAIQMICFGLFAIIAVRFNFTSKQFMQDFQHRISTPDAEASKKEKYVVVDGQGKKLKPNWRALLHIIIVACVLILIRSIYRVIDFSLGRKGYTESHEWCAYVFDALPIFPCVALFNYWHPSKYLPYLGFRLPKEVR